MDTVVTFLNKSAAKSLGLKTYFSINTCVRGHYPTERRTVSGNCIVCEREYKKNYTLTEKGVEAAKLAHKKYASSEKGKKNRLKIQKVYQSTEKGKAVSKRAREKQRAKDSYKLYMKEYGKSARAKEYLVSYRNLNKDKILAHNRWRSALQKRRVPGWADRSKIAEIYAKARMLTETTGTLYHVDHIIPLQGDTVSGFHVETNLRVIPATENLSKNNKLLEELL